MRPRALVALASCFSLGCGAEAGSSPPSGAASGGAGGSLSAGGSSGTGGGSTAGAGGAGASSATGGSSGNPGNVWGADQCASPAAQVGYDVGDSLGELVVRDCDTGDVATLDELCGASATWIFVAHTHCPTCKATAGFTGSVAQQVAGKDVAIAHVVYNDNGTSCATWKQSFELGGLSNVKVYEDPTGDVWSKLALTNATAPSTFVDANRVITFKAHGLTESAVLTHVDEALAQ